MHAWVWYRRCCRVVAREGNGEGEGGKGRNQRDVMDAEALAQAYKMRMQGFRTQGVVAQAGNWRGWGGSTGREEGRHLGGVIGGTECMYARVAYRTCCHASGQIGGGGGGRNQCHAIGGTDGVPLVHWRKHLPTC